MNSNYPYVNALATSFALVAVFLTSLGVTWQWLFWTFYSSTNAVLWSLNFVNSNQGLLYIVLSCIYVTINTYSLITWIKEKKIQEKENINIANSDI